MSTEMSLLAAWWEAAQSQITMSIEYCECSEKLMYRSTYKQHLLKHRLSAKQALIR